MSKRNSISFPDNSLSRKNSLKNCKIRNRTAYISVRKSKDLNKYYLGDPKFQQEVLKIEKDQREDSCSESTTSLIDMKSVSSDSISTTLPPRYHSQARLRSKTRKYVSGKSFNIADISSVKSQSTSSHPNFNDFDNDDGSQNYTDNNDINHILELHDPYELFKVSSGLMSQVPNGPKSKNSLLTISNPNLSKSFKTTFLYDTIKKRRRRRGSITKNDKDSTDNNNDIHDHHHNENNRYASNLRRQHSRHQSHSRLSNFQEPPTTTIRQENLQPNTHTQHKKKFNPKKINNEAMTQTKSATGINSYLHNRALKTRSLSSHNTPAGLFSYHSINNNSSSGNNDMVKSNSDHSILDNTICGNSRISSSGASNSQKQNWLLDYPVSIFFLQTIS